MDAAWALYEAWVAIQTGEVESALVYGFGKSSMTRRARGHDVADRSVLHRTDVAVDGRPRRAAGACVPRSERSRRVRPRRGRGTVAAQRDRQPARGAQRRRRRRRRVLATPVTHDPLRDADIAPVTDGTVAVVIAAGDLARSVCERPAWIRGIEHRIEAHALGRARPHRVELDAPGGERRRCRRRDRRRRAARAVQPRGADPRRGARAERDRRSSTRPAVRSRRTR